MLGWCLGHSFYKTIGLVGVLSLQCLPEVVQGRATGELPTGSRVPEGSVDVLWTAGRMCIICLGKKWQLVALWGKRQTDKVIVMYETLPHGIDIIWWWCPLSAGPCTLSRCKSSLEMVWKTWQKVQGVDLAFKFLRFQFDQAFVEYAGKSSLQDLKDVELVSWCPTSKVLWRLSNRDVLDLHIIWWF